MAKPRTNYDACAYWADSILERAPRADIDVNSIQVRGDTVYSFGRHYPMGKIIRDESGRARTVLLNADHYPSRGFASTPSDQGNVASLARQAVADARWKIELKSVYLSDYALQAQGGMQVLPRDDDPEPEEWPRMQVPRVFHTTDPGPEPVKSPHGCIAGRMEFYEYAKDETVLADEELALQDQAYNLPPRTLFGSDVHPGDFNFVRTYADTGRRYLYARHAGVDTLAWGEEQYEYQWLRRHAHTGSVTYRECPHCEDFRERHARWYHAMHGGWSRPKQGWSQYQAALAAHGSVEAWREAHRLDWHRVRAAKKARAEWMDRNFVPFDFVPKDSNGVPKLTRGYVRRKDAERYFKLRREQDRLNRRRQREHARRDREHRAFLRFRDRNRRQRAIKHERTLIGMAEALTNDLRAVRERITTHELESADD